MAMNSVAFLTKKNLQRAHFETTTKRPHHIKSMRLNMNERLLRICTGHRGNKLPAMDKASTTAHRQSGMNRASI